MCKKLLCLASVVFALSLAWTSPAKAVDPGLTGWWKFDGDGLDASGNGHDGVLAGDAHYEAGYLGQALALDGADDYFSVTGWKGLMSTSPVTVTGWIKTVGDGTMVYWGRNSGTRRVDFRVSAGRLRVEHGSGNIQGNTPVNDGQWHHVAMTIEAGAPIGYPFVKFYLDGQDDTQTTSDPDAFNLVDHASNVDLAVGYRAANGDRFFAGLIDDVRIYDRVLAGPEVQDIMTIGYLASPHSPSPADGTKLEDTWTTLMWTAGSLATSHNVYFSTSFDDVNTGAASALTGNLATNSLPVGFPGFPAPEGLVPGATYYWRVDEVNPTHPDSPWRGKVWSFWIPALTAYDPAPGDGDPVEPVDVDLSWSVGLKGIMHAVYFGTDKDQVASATGAAPNVSTTYDPGPLANATTYYWRVDTFNGAAWVTGPVWTFTTMPVVSVADPNLVVLWTLDEGKGKTVVDWSGHGNNGHVNGAAQWVEGYQGTALKLGASIYVESPYEGITGTAARTCCAWIKTTSTNRNIMSWGQNVATQKWRMRLDVTGGLRIENNGGSLYGITNLADGRWHHVAVVFADDGSPDIGDALLYVDGQPEITGPATLIANPLDTAAGPLRIGESPWHNAPWLDLIDEARVYNKALTQQEIALIMRVDPLLAWAPTPAEDTALDIEHVTSLTWTRGDKATQHDVYFGLDRDAVANADASDTTGVYRGRQSTTSFTPAEGLSWGGGPYFWRVDENNNDSTVTKGRIWSFSVGDYLVVDDIESYNDLPEADAGSNRIYMNWIDGFGTTTNGAFVGNQDVPLTERTNAHSGGQAMPLSYDNNLKFSEVTLTLTSGKDWTRQGVTNLSLWYRGELTNAAEKMYVAINGTAVVYHSDPAAVQTVLWTEWVIPLQDFAAQGVNLSNVTSITIGLGTRGSTTTVGGTGLMYFDDIRLYRPNAMP